MPNFSFKREVDVRIVDSGGTRHKIDISQIDFGQTFQERSFEVKTLHNQSSFEGSVINRANPAEFSLNTPLLKENTNKVIFDRLLDSATFDIYISTQSDDVWKLETCVIQDGTFEINKSRPLRLAISGEASKLSKFSGTIPGSDPSPTTTTYIIPTITTLTLGSDDVSDSIIGLSVELQNSINWNQYDTIHGAVTATDAASSMYPTSFTNDTKVLAGSISKYLRDDSTSVLTWNSNTPLRLTAGNGTQGLDFNITNCSFTNRMSTPEIFREEFNWRMTQNPTALSSVITYTTA
ncbi:MAG: hypothetical protein CL997_05730 [Euryarchaeota archaeon]|jgi:hypothetical protein|nr:hypothetical protein [Euryarchaeota archaeon]|tara:strand:+ start:41 stop:919 length:879 start_codon:yes stop_codon:yes gene_type:complete